MRDRQRIGGVAGWVAAATFVFGFVLYGTVLADYTSSDADPATSVAFLVDHQAALFVWHLVILIVFGIVLVPLVLGLHDRLRTRAAELSPVAVAFGLIWAGLVIAAGMIANVGIGTVVDLHANDPAAAAPVWSAVDSVQNGLGGGNEVVGGLWLLLVSWAGWRTRALPRVLNILGLVAGVAGVVTVVPALEDVGAVFGLGLIVWFTWAGSVLFRGGSHTASVDEDRTNEARVAAMADGAAR